MLMPFIPEEEQGISDQIASLSQMLDGSPTSLDYQESSDLIERLFRGDDRAGALAVLVPHLEGDQLNKARKALAQLVWNFQNRKRAVLLNILAESDAAFLRAFDLPQESYARIAQSIIDICTKWQWL